jgi:hypothetical protein
MKNLTSYNNHIWLRNPKNLAKKILFFLFSRLSSFRTNISNILLGTPLFLVGVALHPQFLVYIHCFLIAFNLRVSKKDKSLCLIWDYKTCNCKYGDYILALSVAKLTSFLGYKTIFAEIYSEESKEKNEQIDISQNQRDTFRAIQSDVLMNKFIDERRDLRKIFGGNVGIEFWQGNYNQFKESFLNPSTKILLSGKVLKRKYTINFYHNMISPLYCFLPSYKKKIFLSSLYSSSFSDDDTLTLALNFRFNPSRPQKDNKVNDFFEIVASCDASSIIYVCTDKLGLEYLRSLPQWNSYSSNLKFSLSDDYSCDFFELLKSKLYCQFSGGGMSASVAVATSQPYICFQPPGHLVPWNMNKLFPFSNQSQIYGYSLDFLRFKDLVAKAMRN